LGRFAFSDGPKEKIKGFINEQKFSEAFVELQALESIGAFSIGKNPEMLWLKGYLEYEIGKKQEARSDLTETMKAEIWRSDSAYYLALLEASDDNYKKVLSYLTLAEKNNTNLNMKSKIQYERIKALVKLKQWTEASIQLRKAERFFKNDIKYPDFLKLVAKVSLELHNNHGACKAIEKLYTKFPTDPIFLDKLPFIEKIEVYGSRLSCPVDNELFANHRRALFALGQIASVNKEIDSWILFYHLEGYEKDLLISSKTVNDGNFVQALELLLKYYEAKKNQIPYLLLLGNVSARAGNVSLSIGSSYRIFQISRSSIQKRKVLFQAAIFSFQIQDYDGAQAKFERYIQSFDRSKNIIDAKWYIAWIQYLKGHYKESAELMADLLKETQRQKKANQYHEKVQYWLAMSVFKAGEILKAKALFSDLVRSSSEISFYSLASQQRLIKLNDLSKVPVASLINENVSTLRVAFRNFFVNAQSFPESYIPFQVSGFEEHESESEDRSLASAAEEEDDDNDNIDDQADVSTSEIQDADGFENSNIVPSAELQAKIEKARFLTSWGFEELGKSEYNDIEHYIFKNEKNKSVLEDYQKFKDYFRLSSLSYNVWFRKGAPRLDPGSRYIWENMYPLAYNEDIKKWASEFNLPQALVWGIMKAESQYRPTVVSPVGAQGLMQIMPFTGKKVSELLGDNQFSAYSLKEPATAIKIGSKYLERMAVNFNNSVPLIAAAYNAGPHRVQNWIYNFGYLEIDEWIEHIPYNETRLYVKKVTSNYFAYLNLYGDAIKSKKISLVDVVPVQINEPMPLVESWD
jgi:soluble lytic murein transglycosylase